MLNEPARNNPVRIEGYQSNFKMHNYWKFRERIRQICPRTQMSLRYRIKNIVSKSLMKI